MSNPRLIQGVYRHGRVELVEVPEGVDEAKVLVVFLDGSDVTGTGSASGLIPTAAIARVPETQSTLAPSATPPPPVPALSVRGLNQPAVNPTVLNLQPPPPAFADPSAAGAILDYASPRKQKGRARLPAQSRLSLVPQTRGVTVIETLTGQGEAVGALIFGVLILICVGWVAATQFHTVRDGAIVLWILWLVEATLMPLVINNTWRRTILTVTADTLTLRFTSPFTTKEYNWRTEVLEDLRLVRTQETPPALAELQIHLVGHPLVKLFTDHMERELAHVVAALRSAVGR